jgi:uncharacterized protein (TIGR02145 family)
MLTRFALLIAFVGVGAASIQPAAENQKAIGSSKRLPDGKEWMLDNLNISVAGSSCYDDAELNCRRYGRLYTWDVARSACQSLGGGWRLPSEDDWRQLAKHYGGVFEDSNDLGKAAYSALLFGGRSGFNAVLGGGREMDAGHYARVDAHGFYWTATESSPGTAWFYNFGKGSLALYRQSEGEKPRAFSVRCVRN